MKVNINDYFIKKTPIYGSEEKIIYDDPPLKPEEVWKNLSIYYEKKILEENKEALKESEFYRLINASKIENEIALTGLDLVNKNVVKLAKITEKKEENVNIKQYILKEIKEILRNKMEELKKNIEDEREFYKKIISVFQDIVYEDDEIRVCYNNINFLNYSEIKNEEKYELKGVSCILKYKGLEFIYSEMEECKNEFERVKEYFFEKQAVQTYKKGYLEIDIVNDNLKGKNDVCRCIISAIRKGDKIESMYEKIIVGICRYILDCLLKNYKEIKILEGSTNKKVDGRSDLYFIHADRDIFKIKYYNDSFDIFLNGKVIIFESSKYN